MIQLCDPPRAFIYVNTDVNQFSFDINFVFLYFCCHGTSLISHRVLRGPEFLVEFLRGEFNYSERQ